jgi:hypothetical protein
MRGTDNQVQNRVNGGSVPFFQDVNPIPRRCAFSGFNSLNGGYIRLSQNASTGNSGTCFGDSVCRSTNVDYRIDTQSAQAFFAYVNGAFGISFPINC